MANATWLAVAHVVLGFAAGMAVAWVIGDGIARMISRRASADERDSRSDEWRRAGHASPPLPRHARPALQQARRRLPLP